MKNKKTYKLKFGCYNCFQVWEQSIPFGVGVEEGDIIGCYLITDRKSIKCPNCGSSEIHKIQTQKEL